MHRCVGVWVGGGACLFASVCGCVVTVSVCVCICVCTCACVCVRVCV